MDKRHFSFIVWAILASPSTAGTPAPAKLVAPPEVDLPLGDAVFPEGPGVHAISDNCVACHSVDHVLNQPSLPRENWEEVVHKMVRAYKAPISPEDQERIVDYLASTKGVK
jgi:hypothetical protein